MLPKPIAKDFGTLRSLSESYGEVATVGFYYGRIRWEVCIDEIGGEMGVHRFVESGVRIQDQGATHDITSATENLRQAGADHVTMWQDGKIDEGPDGVIHHQPESMLFRQSMQAFQVGRL